VKAIAEKRLKEVTSLFFAPLLLISHSLQVADGCECEEGCGFTGVDKFGGRHFMQPVLM